MSRGMSNNDGPKHPDRAADTIRWDQLNPSDARIIERGRKAFRHLTADRTWNDWLEIGEALMVGRTASMQAARANTPHGRVYNRVFGRWLHDYGFGEIDKADRTRLLACLEHRTAIEEWRAELPLRKRLRFNHPATVWRNWKAS